MLGARVAVGWDPQAGVFVAPVRPAIPMSSADLPSPPPPQLVNQHVYSGSADRTAKCWLMDTGERVRTFTAHRRSVSTLKYHAGTCKWPWPSPHRPSLLHPLCHCLSPSRLSPHRIFPGQGLSASPSRSP